ncbi:vWA domain-containing protein [Chondromyces apiculatus]|uniref:Putative membrane protein n=1 Tax=Chondromyces apiculatus DSM 436 TaxID=1192034 RepID=A0A017T330_9BACT|nr:VWA domain-containing protein [Chondromyces apiculatus]EYF03628.1 Putative membrane protein precursor [Chondromyces apiculatus DSM 436]
MRTILTGLVMASLLAGCAGNPAATSSLSTAANAAAASPDSGRKLAVAAPSPAEILASDTPGGARGEPGRKEHAGTWIGAAGASDFVVPGRQETQLGVWIDVPAARRRARVPSAVSLVVDVSGSMGGDKILHARTAARAFVDGLSDGDLISVVTFSDTAREIVPPVVLDSRTRASVRAAVDQLEPVGGTNMFDGLRLGEGRAVTAPSTHAVRRVVLISDGQANVGPSSPEVLGEIAQRGAERGVQVTSLGVGVDYDESTLNELAMRSSGRLYHLTQPRDMPSILQKELALLQETAATDAFVEIVPAPGVTLIGVNGARAERSSDGALRVALGSMFSGQHRELLVRVNLDAPANGAHPLASVRLHFRDAADGNLERVQEVVARYQVTPDTAVVSAHQNARTQTIAAMMDAGQATVEAAQQVNAGDFEAADQKLAVAEKKLQETASRARSKDEQQRALAAAAVMSKQRSTTRAAAAAPAPARRARALEMNGAGMQQMGY